MIYIFVLLLHMGTSNGNEFVSGTYNHAAYQYTTIAECEARRAKLIEYAIGQTDQILISQCAAAQDIIQYKGYSKPTAPEPGVKPNA